MLQYISDSDELEKDLRGFQLSGDFHITLFNYVTKDPLLPNIQRQLFDYAQEIITKSDDGNILAAAIEYCNSTFDTERFDVNVENLFMIEKNHKRLIQNILPLLSNALVNNPDDIKHLEKLSELLDTYSKHQIEDYRLAVANALDGLLHSVLRVHLKAQNKDLNDIVGR